MQNEAALGESTIDVIEAIREVGPRWATRAHAAELTGNISAETADEVSATRAHQLLQPALFGGLQTNMTSHSYAMSVIGEYCMSTAWCAGVWGAHNWMIAQWPESTQAEVWGSHPGARTSASILPKTELQLDEDGSVVIAGKFDFTSGCDHAHWFGVGGIIMDDPTPDPAIVLFPADQSLIDHSTWDVVGLAATGSKNIVIDDPIVVDRQRCLSYVAAATRHAPGLDTHAASLYRSPFRAAASLVLAGPAVGAARAAARIFGERGARNPGPTTASRLAEGESLADAAEAVLLAASAELDYLGTLSSPTAAQAARVHRDTAQAVRLAAQSVNVIFEAAGGNGLRRSDAIQRAWRDATSARNHHILNWDMASIAYGTEALKELASD
jgi:3-hydroxy-9,10-secoandrosta-1,3,5(10)-triene-9,17-dione monooxygenase